MRVKYGIALLAVLCSAYAAASDKSFRSITPDAYAVLDSNGNPIGGWNPMPAAAQGQRDAVTFAAAYDATHANLGSLPNPSALFSSVYGGSVPADLEADTYRAYRYADDMTLASGTQFKVASAASFFGLWNPAGTPTASGMKDLVVTVTTYLGAGTSSAGPFASQPLTSIALVYRNLTAGFISGVIDLSQVSQGWALPGVGGAVELSVATTVSSSTVVPLTTESFQLALVPMRSPGDPVYPGTNPSKSSKWAWIDSSKASSGLSVNAPDYIFQDLTNTAGGPFTYSERVDLDRSSSADGIYHPAIGLFVDTSGRTVSGKLSFGPLAPGTAPKTVTVTLKRFFTVHDAVATVQADGSFVVKDITPGAPGGPSTFSVKVYTWLRKNVAYSTSAGSVNLGTIDLTNGDCNGDDNVDFFDYLILSGAYETSSGGPGYIAGADLNRDGEVDFFDYLLLSDSYEKSGDPVL